MDLVERAARAIHAIDEPGGSYEGFVAHTPDPQKYIRQARAAIEAMREDKTHCGVCGCAIYPNLEKALANPSQT